jgi:hypothetical protein
MVSAATTMSAAVGMTFELLTAAHQFDNTLTVCTAGTPARFQILMLL